VGVDGLVWGSGSDAGEGGASLSLRSNSGMAGVRFLLCVTE
jgi:hypothetical protein